MQGRRTLPLLLAVIVIPTPTFWGLAAAAAAWAIAIAAAAWAIAALARYCGGANHRPCSIFLWATSTKCSNSKVRLADDCASYNAVRPAMGVPTHLVQSG